MNKNHNLFAFTFDRFQLNSFTVGSGFGLDLELISPALYFFPDLCQIYD